MSEEKEKQSWRKSVEELRVKIKQLAQMVNARSKEEKALFGIGLAFAIGLALGAALGHHYSNKKGD